MFANPFHGAYADVSCIKCICMMWYFERDNGDSWKKTVDALDAYVIFWNLSVYAMKCFLVLFTDVIKFEQSNVELDKIAFFFQLSGLFFKDSKIKFNFSTSQDNYLSRIGRL